uniref:killer cell lectin-like receptor subfamily G member 2 isoform X2 n=1 Tax=Halichoerus grypus TaxID=9711 RepID=UPI00165971A5|nr:killer cell lectin-like receptor subfamily G member 2 isoform X2 [Halichoerus grypus]
MQRARAASGGDPPGAEFPMEPLGNQVAGLEQPQVPAEERRLESPESSPSLARAVKEAAGAGQDLSGGKKLPPPRPALLRLPAPSLGYGAFRRQASAGPSPAPSPRFLTVPVPESPAFSRHSFPALPLLPRTPARAERGLDAEGRVSPADGRSEPPGSPTCRGRCRDLGLEKEEDAALLHRAETGGDDKLPRAIKLIGLPMYMKSLRWALAVMAVFLAVSAVAIVALASRAGIRCRPCPQGWMWSEEHCYYVSTEAQAWEASQAFCSAHQATLPLLSHTQDFLSRYPVTKYSWVAARRGPQGWHWIDGAPLSPPLLPEEEEDQPELKCGALEGGRLVALDCASPRPWVCAKGTK